MQQIPVLDWTCSRCGASDTYQLVRPGPGDPQPKPLINWKRKIPTLDWTCSHCGANDTYQLVPMNTKSHST